MNELSLATTLHACRHCGQESADDFCCAGCKTVYALLHEKGLGSFYEKKQDERLLPVDAEWLARDWSRVVVDDSVELLRFHVDGLSCSACVWILERLEQVSPLIEWSRLDMSRSVLIVKRQTGAPFATVAKAVSELGFKIELLESESDQESRLRKENRRELIQVGVVGALTGNIMIFSVSMYGGATGDFATGFKILMGLLSLPVVTWGAAPLYRNTWTALKNRQISLDFPIALAVFSGALAGWIGIFSGLDTLFFDSVSMLVLLLQGSRTALRFLRQKLDPAEDRLPLWMHESVQGLDGKALSPIDLTTGRRFRAMKFNRLPVDARVMSREIEWDFSVLNGESRPVVLPLGSEIPAGARLLSESAELETLRAASESRIAKLVRDWREGPRTRPSMTALADRVGQVFTFVVLAVAICVIAFVDDGWMRALTLLVVSCPCVFGIAIPFAEAMAMKRAQESGLLIREPTFFDRLLAARSAFLDKTGTLTTGKMTVASADFVATHSDQRNHWLSLIAWMEKDDAHPVARALCEYAEQSGNLKTSFAVASTRLISGGRELLLDGTRYSLHPLANSSNLLEVEFAANGERIARFCFQDQMRDGAKELVSTLRHQDLAVIVLSGDQPAPVAATLKDVGLEKESGVASLLPNEKALQIARCQTPSLMIGDGANDAEALQSATASIAVRGEFAQCLEAADAVLLAASLRPVAGIFTIAKRLRLALVLSLIFATSFNLVSAVLAITGLMSPLIAATLMPISSLIVTLISIFCLKGVKA